MNVFRFELKAQLPGALGWTGGLLAVLAMMMGGIYPVFEQSTEGMIRVLESFPKEFSAAFGLDLQALFGYGGFYAFAFSYLSLMGAMMAVWLAAGSFGREKRCKCTDFLLTKPLPRTGVFGAKLAAGFCWLLVCGLCYTALSLWLGLAAGAEFGPVLGASLVLLPTQLCFYAAGVLVGVLLRRVRSVSALATAFGFGGFILTALVNLFEEEALRYIAPLKYYDPAPLFSGGGLVPAYAATGAAVTAACLALAFWRYTRSDIAAV